MPKKILVSGANGFIASHSIALLLARGDTVIGTVRNPADIDRNKHLLALPGAGDRLNLVAAELTQSDPFSACTDVDAVLHMASPYVIDVKDPQRDLVAPAVEGTLAMLRASARSPRIRRVVLTSSMAAITDEPDGRVLTENDWNEKSSSTRNPYYFSKAMAERAAWDFMEKEKPDFALVAINPFMVVGPAMTREINTSNQILVDIANGKYPAIMALEWGFVDVRDVAEAHVRAIDAPGVSGRYICAAGKRDMTQVIDLIRKGGASAKRLPALKLDGGLGTGLMKIASYLQPPGIGSYMRTHLGRSPHFDNTKIRRALDISFRDLDATLIETVRDLIRAGHIASA
jgi:dihydroflavonol-4-reductase